MFVSSRPSEILKIFRALWSLLPANWKFGISKSSHYLPFFKLFEFVPHFFNVFVTTGNAIPLAVWVALEPPRWAWIFSINWSRMVSMLFHSTVSEGQTLKSSSWIHPIENRTIYPPTTLLIRQTHAHLHWGVPTYYIAVSSGFVRRYLSILGKPFGRTKVQPVLSTFQNCQLDRSILSRPGPHFQISTNQDFR